MTERYGFHVGMSYQEAQRRYWRLAMQWHPDRAGTSPTQQREMRDLNQAWGAAKQCFAAAQVG